MARPTFLKSLLDSWQLTLTHGRSRDLIPYWMIASAGSAGWLVYELPATFWDGTKLDVAISVLSGLLTFNGIILALCWSAFGKIYEIIGAGAFCAHLRKHNILNHYLHFVSWCHAAQVAAICSSAFALFALWLPFQVWVMQCAVGFATATSAYAVIQGISTSSAMQDLIWRKSEYDELEAAKAKVAPVKNGYSQTPS